MQCPYHAWSYGFDGSLRNAPHTDEIEGFDPRCYGLRAVRVAVVEGIVLIDLSGTRAGARRARRRHGARCWRATGSAACAARSGSSTSVDANWKAIAENYSECLHCPGVHPELNQLSHYLSGETLTGAGAWCGGSMTLRDGAADDGAATTRRHTRPPIDGPRPRTTSARSSTTCSSPTRSSRCTPTT